MTTTRRQFTLGLAALAASQAGRAEGRPDFAREAREATEYIQRTFWDPEKGLYRPASPPDPKPNTLPYDFMWANGVQFSNLVAATRHDRARSGAKPPRYRPVLDAFFQGLDRYWDHRANIPAYDAYWSSPGSSDKYYDDNAWMVISLVEAYAATREPRYLDRAEAAQKFVLSGWDEQLGGGIFWKEDRKSKNTCSNAPAAQAALALSRYRRRDEYLRWAQRIVEWTNAHLQSPEGPFWDNVALDGKVERTRWTYNTALMLRSNLGLYRATKQKSYLAEARRLGEASQREFVNPSTGAFRDNALFSHLLVEAFLDLYRETREPYLKETALKNAEFLVRSVRDPTGGYWNEWKLVPDRQEPRKLLMANAAAARLLWLVSDLDLPAR